MPESKEHFALKKIVANKLSDWFGVSVDEYPSTGHNLDVFSVTKDGKKIYIEIIWSPAQFFKDLNMIEQSDADVKIAIVSSKILEKNDLVKEYKKAVISQRERGVQLHENLINGNEILEDEEKSLKKIKKIIDSLLGQIPSNDNANLHPNSGKKLKIVVNSKDVDKSLKKLCVQIVDEYNNFSRFQGSANKPLIEQFSVFDLKKYFVEIAIQDLNNRSIHKRPINFVHKWINEDEETNGLFILGDFGSGKSTLCSHIAYQLANTLLEKTNSRIPIFIPLRDITRNFSEDSLLESINKVIALDSKNLLRLLKLGKIVFILDGFDEMTNRTDWKKTSSDFNNIVDVLCKFKSKVIVTCRTHFFKEDSELWGKDTKLMKSLRATKNFKIISMVPFSKKQILEYIAKRTPNHNLIWTQIRNTYNLEDLCKRPLLIDMIISTLPKLVNLGTEINASTLYEKYTEDWIERDTWRSQIDPEKKSKLMEKLAFHLFCSENPSISYDILKDYVGNEFGLKNDSDIVSYIDYDVRTCSFFHRDGVGNYRFMHKSILEFFVAKKIAREINFNQFMDLNKKLLTDEILFFSKFLINKFKKTVLFDALNYTKGKNFDEFGVLGGNAVNLLNKLGANFVDKDFSGCTINGGNLHLSEKCDLSKSTIKNAKILTDKINDCRFQDAHFESCEFTDIKITNCDLKKCKFFDCDFLETMFLNDCPMDSSEFIRCSFENITFKGVSLKKSVFADSKAGLRWGDGIRFIEAKINSAKFKNVVFFLSLFYNSNLNHSRFTNSKLVGSSFFDSDFSETIFDNGSLSFATLKNTTFEGANFFETRIYETYMNEKEVGNLHFSNAKIKKSNEPLHMLSVSKKIKVKHHDNLAAFCRLNNAIEQFGLTNEFEESVIKLFNDSWDAIRGSGRTEGMAACFFALLKKTERPRLLPEVTALFGVSSKQTSRIYRQMLKTENINRVSVDCEKWIEIFCDELGISEKTSQLAKKFLKQGGKTITRTRAPSTNAGSLIYLACKTNGEKMTLKEISSMAQKTTTSITNASKCISKILKNKGLI